MPSSFARRYAALEVVDVDADVVVQRRVGVPLEEVELQVAEPQVLDRERERVGRDRLHPEDFDVEPRGFPEIPSVDAHVVEPRRAHSPRAYNATTSPSRVTSS